MAPDSESPTRGNPVLAFDSPTRMRLHFDHVPALFGGHDMFPP